MADAADTKKDDTPEVDPNATAADGTQQFDKEAKANDESLVHSTDQVSADAIQQPLNPTQPRLVEGKDGVDRVLPRTPRGWEPAPVEPTQAEIDAAEARQKAVKDLREQRLTSDPADQVDTSSDSSKSSSKSSSKAS